MIRIYKNHTSTINTKHADRRIRDKEFSSRVLEILSKLEEFYNPPINKEFNPEHYALCEELIQLVKESGLEVDIDDELYLAKEVRSVNYWYIHREVNDSKYCSDSENRHEIVYDNPDDDVYKYDFDEYSDKYFIEAVGF